MAVAAPSAAAFMTLIADSLRLRAETLAMAFVYTHKYHHHLTRTPTPDLLDDHARPPPSSPSHPRH